MLSGRSRYEGPRWQPPYPQGRGRSETSSWQHPHSHPQKLQAWLSARLLEFGSGPGKNFWPPLPIPTLWAPKGRMRELPDPGSPLLVPSRSASAPPQRQWLTRPSPLTRWSSFTPSLESALMALCPPGLPRRNCCRREPGSPRRCSLRDRRQAGALRCRTRPPPPGQVSARLRFGNLLVPRLRGWETLAFSHPT